MNNYVSDAKRVKTSTSESRLALVLLLIGWQSCESFLKQSFSLIMWNQLHFNTQWKALYLDLSTAVSGTTSFQIEQNQSKLEVNACSRCGARENVCERVRIGFGSSSDWMKKWRELALFCNRLLARFSLECRKVIGFVSTTPHDWLKKLAPLFHPIKSKTKTNRDYFVRVFPRLASATCNYFEFLIGSLYCRCPLWLARVITNTLVLVIGNRFNKVMQNHTELVSILARKPLQMRRLCMIHLTWQWFFCDFIFCSRCWWVTFILRLSCTWPFTHPRVI